MNKISVCIALPLVLLGVFGNASIILVTIINKVFHHRSGILIALLAAFNLV